MRREQHPLPCPHRTQATKVRGRVGSGVNQIGLSRRHILESIDGSLKRLGTDYVDLYQVHGFDAVTPIDETMRGLEHR
jgi:aryl-alcohol dehydrogenase-like predicted oxidoreductase